MSNAISIGLFRRNVLKTVFPKTAKSGLRYTSKNTQRTNVATLGLVLARNVGNLVAANADTILGLQATPENIAKTRSYMGDVAYAIVGLARLLKVKTPTSTKRKKLVGTRTAALLEISTLSTDILYYTGRGLFESPVTSTESKLVTIPGKTNADGSVLKEQRNVQVLNVVASASADAERDKQIASLLTLLIDLFWSLCYDLYKEAPAGVMSEKMASMAGEYPGVTFATAEEKPAVAGAAAEVTATAGAK
jgi:hypothetical protein